MTSPRIDLHAHTIHSDGTFTPTALVQIAAVAGLAGLAVTDHDTTSGFAEAWAAGQTAGVEVWPGCEISTQADGVTVHVLAHGFDPGHPSLEEFLVRVRADRDARNARILERLAAFGVPVSMEDVCRHVHGRVVARPHVARAMVDRGHVPDVRTAFQLYLGDRAPAYVAGCLPAPQEAIAVVREAGGVCSVAHPKQIRLPSAEAYLAFFGRLAQAGLVGIEVDHPSHHPDERALFRDLAAQLGLVPTGGSDFHGDNKPHIALGVGDGTIAVGWETWERLRARRPVAG